MVMMKTNNTRSSLRSFFFLLWLSSTMMTMIKSVSATSPISAVRSLVVETTEGRGFEEEEDKVEQPQQRKMINMQYSFSEEGLPFTIPLISIRLYPTKSPPLSNQSKAAIEDAMREYLLATLPGELRRRRSSSSDSDGNDNSVASISSSTTTSNGNGSNNNNSTDDGNGSEEDDDDDSGSDVPITDVTVKILNVMSVSDTERRNRYHRNLRQGSEVEMEVQLDFARQPIPSDNEIVAGMDDTMNDLNPFIQDYLLKQPSIPDEIANVDSAMYDSGTFTASPSSSPSTSPPTSLDVVDALEGGDSNEDGNNDGDGSSSTPSDLQDRDVIGFARATGSENDDTGKERPLKTLYYAVIAGVIAMILTMIFIGRRRQRARHIVGDDTLTIEQIKAQPPEIDFEEGGDGGGGGWVEHMPDGQTTIQVSEMEPTPADVAAAQSNPSRYHVHNYSSTNDHDSGIHTNDGEGRNDVSSGDAGGYLNYTPYGSPQIDDDTDDQGYVLSPASSYDSSSLHYDDEQQQFHNHNAAMYNNNNSSNNDFGGGLPRISYGDGNGYTSEENDNPSSNDIPRGAIKRVDMTGNVRSSNEI